MDVVRSNRKSGREIARVIIDALRWMVVGTVTNTAGTESSKTVDVESLLMPTGDAFRCPACNTLAHGEGFSPKQLAEEMVKQNMGHVPMCVFGMGED